MQLTLQPTFFVLPFLELFILYLLSRSVFARMSLALRFFLRKSKWTYYFLALLFLPGTYIHEMSHFLMAKILFVPTFGINLRPKVNGNLITLGSVEIAKTDFVRRFLVGAAPFLFGTLLLIGSMHILLINEWHKTSIGIGLEAFLVFEIGNTMFMSKRDLEGSWKVVISIIGLAFFLYLSGFNGKLFLDTLTPLAKTFEHISFYLGIPIVIDIILILALSLFI